MGDQTGFIKGHYLKDNVRKVINLMEWVQKQKDSMLYIYFDTEKAFDQLDWTFLKQVLIKWRSILYNKLPRFVWNIAVCRK